MKFHVFYPRFLDFFLIIIVSVSFLNIKKSEPNYRTVERKIINEKLIISAIKDFFRTY